MENSSIFQGKNILVTGGSGSFGQAFARRLLQEDACKKVIIFSRDEWKQWNMRETDPLFNSDKIRYFLGDVRDKSRLLRAFNEVDYVIHAAALKQVPVAEYNPTEFVKTNVQGAMNVLNAAIDAGVKKVVALSTDKAVNPINLYGATKLCSDKIFVSGNAYVGARGFPVFSVVRYGNVAGSRGSVLPFWKSILQKGDDPLPITDERMTRFWITLEQAVDFVVKCIGEMDGGEIFVPKIPSMRVVDLAKALAPGRPHTITGIRSGEKLHELMISADDSRSTLEYETHYTILPQYCFWKEEEGRQLQENGEGKFVNEGFSYTSDNNTQWLSPKQLEEIIKPFTP